MADTEKLNESAKTAAGQQQAHEQVSETLADKQKNVAKAMAEAKAGVQNAKDTAEEAEEQAAAYDAEEQAAQAVEQGQIISVTEALALVEQEQKANAMATKAKMQALQTSAQYVSTAMVEGTDLFMSTLDSTGKGLIDGVLDPATRKAALGAVGIGAGTGLFVQNEGVQSAVISAFEAFTGLQAGNESETGEKFVGGVDSPESNALYAAETANGESTDPYAAEAGDGSPAPEKELPEEDGYKPPAGVEALSASDDELNALADVEQVVTGEATQGKGLDDWFDSVAQMFRESENGGTQPLAVGLMESISQDGITGTALKVATQVVGPKLAAMRNMTAEIDANEQNQAGQDGPDYPGS